MAIVTISRGTYSLARNIAEELARRLGCPCAGQEQIFAAAKDFGVPESELNAALVKPPAMLLVSPGKKGAILNVIRTALLKLAVDGNLVYHGFVGHLLFEDVRHVLRVRVIAGMEHRIAAARERHRLTREEAVKRIARRDQQSSCWSTFLYGVDWRDPSLYDLVLNIEQLSLEGAVTTLERMIELAEFRPDEQSQKAFDDLLLRSLVWAEIHLDPRTRLADVTVEAEGGRVLVSGAANSEEMVRLIPEVAGRVPGVREVVSEVGIGSHWFW